MKFDVEAPDGKRRTRYVTFRGTYKEAKRELTRLLSSADAGTLPDPSNLTVAGYLSVWLDHATGLAPKTLERYRELAQHQIVPALGAVPLQKLKPQQVQAWHAKLLKSGLTARTVGHAHRVLNLAIKNALANGLLARNVASVHKPPKVEEQEIEILTPEQITEVRAKLQGHTLLPIVELALATGLRRGELLALRWGDIDLDAGTLCVEHSVEETNVGLRLKSPKTRRGRRKIGLAPETVGMLRAHKAKQLEIRFAVKLGNVGSETLVFSTVEGDLISPHSITRAWGRIRRAKKLPKVSFHSFRHTHASMLIANGTVDILSISRRLGHSKASVTLDVYGHLLPGGDAAVTKAISTALSKTANGSSKQPA
jgi:integrase